MLLLMAAPASAIPICSAGTMADYIAFGSTGCNVKNLTFLNFSYSGSFKIFLNEERLPAPPSEVAVQPRTNPSLGAGGAALGFSLLRPPPSLFIYWGDVTVGFEVFSRTAPGIVGNRLSADLQSIANLQSAFISERAVPGGSLSIEQGVGCFGSPPLFPHFSPFCANPTNLSIPFTRFQEIDIGGTNVNGFEAGFATPEPATLLLVSTGAAGVGLVRWAKRRRQVRC
jgi:hypothetical protein